MKNTSIHHEIASIVQPAEPVEPVEPELMKDVAPGCDTKNCWLFFGRRTESPSCGRRPSKDAATNKRPSRVTSKASSNVSRPESGGSRFGKFGKSRFFHQKKGLFVTPILVITKGESGWKPWWIMGVTCCDPRSGILCQAKQRQGGYEDDPRSLGGIQEVDPCGRSPSHQVTMA